MIVIFVTSPPNIVPALQILHRDPQHEYVIVTSDESIRKYFESFENDLRIYFFEEIDYRLSKNIFRFMRNMVDSYRLLKKAKEVFRKFDCSEIIYFTIAFGESSMAYMNILPHRHSVKISRYILVKNILPQKPNYSMRNILNALMAKIILKIPVKYYGPNSVPVVQERYLIQNNIMTKIWVKDSLLPLQQKLASKIQLNFQFDKIKVLFVTQDAIGSGDVDSDEYIYKMDELIYRIQQEIGNENIYIKPHPQVPALYGRERQLKLIPEVIPSELIMANFDIVIGYSSMSLIEASKNNQVAISLLKYINATSAPRFKNYYKYLENNSTSIRYPTRIAETVKAIKMER